MADELSNDEVGRIVRRQKPGFEIVPQATPSSDSSERAEVSDRRHVVRSAADLDYLKKKFLGGASDQASTPTATQSGSRIVKVRPVDGPATDSAVGAKEGKVVVVSATDKRIVGEQG